MFVGPMDKLLQETIISFCHGTNKLSAIICSLYESHSEYNNGACKVITNVIFKC